MAPPAPAILVDVAAQVRDRSDAVDGIEQFGAPASLPRVDAIAVACGGAVGPPTRRCPRR